MRSVLARWCPFGLAFAVTLLTLLAIAPQMFAQGGEPEYFAIRGAKIVPVSGPPVEDATVVMAHGIITAIGKDVAIPPDAWVIEGKGLTVYPGLFDSFTDVGIPAATPAPGGGGEGGPRRPSGRKLRPRTRRSSGNDSLAAAPPMKRTSATSASSRGAMRDSRQWFPRPRAACYRDKPPCSIWPATARATWS